jgi:2-keto-4-pentenoate hydratase
MTPEHCRSACDLLYSHWMNKTRLDALPPEIRPSTRSDAYAVQAMLDAHSASPLFGWKIAATSAAGQAHVRVDGPLAGRLLAERVIDDGGAHTLGRSHMRVAEVEFAFRFGESFVPQAGPYTQEDVLSRVATLHPAIELPDSRYNDFEHAGIAQLIADNACADTFVLGPPTNDSWRALDLAAHPVHAIIDDSRIIAGMGSNVLGDPRIALTWLVNELAEHGITVAAGQVVTTGTCVVPIPIEPGNHVVGDLGVLGRVSISII